MPLSKIDSASLNTPITAVDLAYTGTLTGNGGIVNIGAGQVYKDASGNVGIGTASPAVKLDVAGAVSATTGSFSGNLSFNSGYGSAAVGYGCRAWVNFNGAGTVAIRASGNVSSITDNGVGDYTVNFTTAMPDANYSGISNTAWESTAGNNVALAGPTFNGAKTATAFQIRTVNPGSNATLDSPFVFVAIFR